MLYKQGHSILIISFACCRQLKYFFEMLAPLWAVCRLRLQHVKPLCGSSLLLVNIQRRESANSHDNLI